MTLRVTLAPARGTRGAQRVPDEEIPQPRRAAWRASPPPGGASWTAQLDRCSIKQKRKNDQTVVPPGGGTVEDNGHPDQSIWGESVSTKPGVLHTADPTAFPEAAAAVRGTFGLERMIMVGDRGIITTARITDLRKMDGMAWITCLRYPAIKKLMAGDGPLQLSLFDEQDLAEITSPDFPSSG